MGQANLKAGIFLKFKFNGRVSQKRKVFRSNASTCLFQRKRIFFSNEDVSMLIIFYFSHRSFVIAEDAKEEKI